MTLHARTEQLLATSIDFSLTPAEQTEVADHLAACSTCRTLAAAYRTDAAGLREVAFAEPPASVSAAILRAAARPRARTVEPWQLLLAAALLLTALLGTAAVIGALNSRPALVVVVPIVSPSAEPATAEASPVEVPAALQVACDGTHPAILTPLVKAQPDGIHIDVTNTSGQRLDFSIDDANGLAIQGDSLSGASGSYTYSFGPGSYRFTCNRSTAAFTVADPDGLYTSSDLECGSTTGGGTVGTNDYAAGARGPQGSLLDIARLELRGLQSGDVVERAGYPQAPGEALVRVVRQGRVVAGLGYLDDGHGGWLIAGTQACSGSGLTVVPSKG